MARLGGELTALAEVESGGREALAARLRDAVAGVGTSVGVTGSVGVTDVRPGDAGDEVSAAPTRPCAGPRAPAATGSPRSFAGPTRVPQAARAHGA
ncbi:hypothetical protein ACU610_02860 [Geodermatophilus sp. URMC 61]|uniref:hypothetical protein n=1 Tax=Geodermatophilus sp. URMC 61 TaxID=3423411 RepID=UPI00406C8BFD